MNILHFFIVGFLVFIIFPWSKSRCGCHDCMLNFEVIRVGWEGRGIPSSIHHLIFTPEFHKVARREWLHSTSKIFLVLQY